MTHLIDKDALVAEIEKRKIPFERDIENGYYPTYLCALMDFEDMLDTLNLSNVERTVKEWKEEPVSEDLEEAAIEYCGGNKGSDARVRTGFIMGAKWQKVNLWKPADGDDLPEIDKGVIVLAQPYPLEKSEYVVSFAHRPNPDGCDGKSVITGKMVHYTPKLYDKGGWNIPNVKYWLDVELPKEIEL